MVVCKFFQQGNCRYGQNCRFDHIYGSKYSYRAAPVQNESHGHEEFSNRTRQGSAKDAASSLFRSAVQNTSVFNNNAINTVVGHNHTSRGSVFNRLGPPQNLGGFHNNQAQSIFAQANQNVFGQQQPTNIFQTHKPEAAKSIFAQANQNIFGTTNSRNDFNQAQDAVSVFASAERSVQYNQQNSSPFINTTGNVFQISEKQTSNVFAPSIQYDNNSDLNEVIYSKLEDLSRSDIEAFENLDFKLGFIPELPPPKSLCV